MSFDLSFGSLTGLIVSFVLGGLVGLEREFRQRTAGLRTNVLVSIGAAAFVELGGGINGAVGSAQVVSYIITGMGFLGAGVILKEGTQIRGLNTAATLWATAAVGACAGAGQPLQASFLTVLILAGNTLLRPIVEFVHRRPITRATEALYQIHVTCGPSQVSAARDALSAELKNHRLPFHGIETIRETADLVEMVAMLLPTSPDPRELDGVVGHLKLRTHVVHSATWSVKTTV